MLRPMCFLGLMCVVACTTHVPSDFGAKYLGAKYINDPLGEGAGYDTDPLIRTDAFDCMTYVETVLACGDVSRLTQIRYADGIAQFTHRNHFFVADWVANNSDLVENISDLFGPVSVRHGRINRQSWLQTVHNMAASLPTTDAQIEYVPYSQITIPDISSPILVAFVVDNASIRKKIGSDILVSHVGFLLPGGVLRHASSSAGAVVDTDFAQYIASRAAGKSNLGVAFFRIKEFCK